MGNPEIITYVEVEWLTPRKPVQNSTPVSGGGTTLTINGEAPGKTGSLSQNDYSDTTNDTPTPGHSVPGTVTVLGEVLVQGEVSIRLRLLLGDCLPRAKQTSE